MIFGSRVTQAREFRNVTQVELAGRVCIKQGTLADIERGRNEPSEMIASRIAEELNFPLSFFQREPPANFGVGSLEFRAKSAVSAKAKKRAYQFAGIVFELASSLAKRLTMPPVRLPQIDGDPELAAAIVRSELGISPNAPIENLTDVLERAGVLVFALPSVSSGSLDGIDGFSTWAGVGRKLIPSVYLSAERPGDRARLTLAHEIGELTLSDLPPGRAREAKANVFAGCLLLPGEALREELTPPFSINDFAKIKKRYGVSIQAGLVRARQLGIIDERRYHSLFQQLSARGWRTQEPPELDIAFEKPRALHRMAELLYGDPIDYVRLGADASLDPLFVRQLLSVHANKRDIHSGALESRGTVLEFARRSSDESTDELKLM